MDSNYSKEIEEYLEKGGIVKNEHSEEFYSTRFMNKEERVKHYSKLAKKTEEEI